MLRTLAVGVLAVLVAGAAGCTAAEPDRAACRVRIAVIAPLSGPAAGVGAPLADAARLAAAHAGTRGQRCQVALQVFDSEGDPAKAAGIAARLATDRSYVGVVGPMTSGEVRQTLGTFAAGGLTMITPAATATDLTPDHPTVFHRMLVSDEVQGKAIGRYVAGELGARRVVVVDDGAAYGGPLGDQVAAAAGDVVAARDTVQPGGLDFSATVSKIRSARADAVVYAGYPPEGGPLVKQLRAAGLKVPFIGGDGLYGSDFVAAAGVRAAAGAVVMCPCQPTTAPAARRFVDAYKSEYGRGPGPYGAETYDATTVLFRAVGTGNTTREQVESFVDGYDNDGVTKRIRFDGRGDVATASAVVWAYRIRGGEPVPIGPIDAG